MVAGGGGLMTTAFAIVYYFCNIDSMQHNAAHGDTNDIATALMLAAEQYISHQAPKQVSARCQVYFEFVCYSQVCYICICGHDSA